MIWLGFASWVGLAPPLAPTPPISQQASNMRRCTMCFLLQFEAVSTAGMWISCLLLMSAMMLPSGGAAFSPTLWSTFIMDVSQYRASHIITLALVYIIPFQPSQDGTSWCSIGVLSTGLRLVRWQEAPAQHLIPFGHWILLCIVLLTDLLYSLWIVPRIMIVVHGLISREEFIATVFSVHHAHWKSKNKKVTTTWLFSRQSHARKVIWQDIQNATTSVTLYPQWPESLPNKAEG